MKYTAPNNKFSYLANALTEVTKEYEMSADGKFVSDNSVEAMHVDRLPLVVLYLWSLHAECADTYESSIGETHYQWRIDPDEALHIPGCLEIISARQTGWVFDIWQSEQNGFIQYDLTEEIKTTTGQRVRVSVDIYLDVKDGPIDPDNFDIEDYVYIVPKENHANSDLNISWTQNEIDGVEVMENL